MDRKSILHIMGGAVVIGIAAYGAYEYFLNQEESIEKKQKYPSSTAQKSTVEAEVINKNDKHDQSVIANFEQVQNDTVASIRKHHQEAAQQLEDTLNMMDGDSVRYEETLTEVNSALDELLK